jgi:hypothetical protein
MLLLGQHRGGDGIRDSIGVKFARQTPIRAPFVERIQHQVATLGPIKLLNELGRWVINYGRFAALFDLVQYLPDGVRLAASGVFHEQNVARFELARDTKTGRQQPPLRLQPEPDSVCLPAPFPVQIPSKS